MKGKGRAVDLGEGKVEGAERRRRKGGHDLDILCERKIRKNEKD